MRNMKKGTIGRLTGYLKGGKKMLAVSVIVAVISSGLSILIPYLAGKAVDCVTGGEGSVDLKGVTIYLLIMTGFIIISSVFQYILQRINNSVSYNMTLRIRNDSYGKIRKLPVSFLDRASAGNIQSMIISDIETIGDGVLLFLNQFASGVTALVLTLGVMLFINYRIALLVVVFTPLSFIVSYFIASRSFRSFRKQSEIRAKQTSLISEEAGNFTTIHAFNTESVTAALFDETNESYRKASGKATFLSSITNPSTRFINALIYAGVAFISADSVMSGVLTVGAMTSLLMYSNQFMKPFNDLSAVYTELSDAFACMTRVFAFLDEKELGEDLSGEAARQLPWDRDGDFTIEFRNVSFSYVEGKKVLDDVSFKVESGCSCAIVGPTGCGKTTLINLLLRFYEPDSGSILVNGIDIKDIPRNVLRSYLGVVSQDTWFRNGSIMSNIKYGRPSMTDEEAKDKAVLSGADRFIRKLPSKYMEKISSSRDDISEGQRQLLSITRAMASDPCILILDEATSSVDILTEVRIQKAVKDLLAGRTGIIIAHRLSTIIDADKIVVIENGRVSETGPHKELIEHDGFYRKLYSSYIGG